jgi:hypothetical protein
MKRKFLACLISVFVLVPAAANSAGAPAPQAAVPVYDSTQIAFARYSVIKRVGVDDWSSSFRIRGHNDLATAQQAVIGEAARVGADGVINLTCFDQTDRIFKPEGYFCYGNAIRLKK